MGFVGLRRENDSGLGRSSRRVWWAAIFLKTLLCTVAPTLVQAASLSMQQQQQQQQQQYPDYSIDDSHNTYDPQNTNDATTLQSLSKELPWGAINIVVVTDVHSWIAGGNHRDDPAHWPYDGHRQKVQDADYGDVLSFYQRLEGLVETHNNNHDNNNNKNNENKRDIFFVMNGDFVDGTGLSSYPPTHLAPLLQHMPWDAVNVGNHELYHDETIRYLVEHEHKHEHEHEHDHYATPINSMWKNNSYLSSNTILTETPDTPMAGSQYTYLEGKNTNTTILTFGFLYDFNEGSPSATNVPVWEAVQHPWFRSVLGDDAPRNFDAILVLAHMDCLHPLVEVILDGIRAALPPHRRDVVPIQFVMGHTHRRCHSKLDHRAESFEAGRFLDTIGFVSFDTNTNTNSKSNNSSSNNSETNNNSNNFQHRFLDANKESLHETLVLAHRRAIGETDETDENTKHGSGNSFEKDFGTPEGRALTTAIQTTKASLGLDEVLGCAPQTFGLFVGQPPLHDTQSLWHLYTKEMIPVQLLKAFLGSGSGSSNEEGDGDDDNDDDDDDSIEPIFVSGTGVLRYSLFEGPVTVNDVIAISPFDDTIHEVVALREEQTESGVSETMLPIYGWQLIGLLEAANWLYEGEGQFGMPTFVSSTLPSSSFPRAKQQPDSIDSERQYRLFATDYDAARLLKVLAVMKQNDEDPSITHGRSYHSHVTCRGNNPDENCYLLTELWKDYIREQMPCDAYLANQEHSLRGPLDVSFLSAQMLPPLSGTTAHVHSRLTPAQENVASLANDQKAAFFLVVGAVAIIAYLLVYPPKPHEGHRFAKTARGIVRSHVRHQPERQHHPTGGRIPSGDANSRHRNRARGTDEGDADVQLVPLRRHNTYILSQESYGSI